MDAAASAMAVSSYNPAVGSHSRSQTPQSHSPASVHHKKPSLASGSKCGAQPSDADFFYDAALAATAAAAAVIPMYWLYVHSSRGSKESTKSAEEFSQNGNEIHGIGLSGIEFSTSSAAGDEAAQQVNEEISVATTQVESTGEEKLMEPRFHNSSNAEANGLLGNQESFTSSHSQVEHKSIGDGFELREDGFSEHEHHLVVELSPLLHQSPRGDGQLNVDNHADGDGFTIQSEKDHLVKELTSLVALEADNRSGLKEEADPELHKLALAQVVESPSDLSQAIERLVVKVPKQLPKVEKSPRLKPRTRVEDDLTSYDKLIRAGRIKESLEVLEEMESNSILDMNKVYHSRFYQECRKQLAVDEAFRFTRLIKSPTLSTFNMLLSVCCTAADTDGAFGALMALRNAGLKPDCMIYTTVISTCAKALKTDLLFQVFQEMQHLGIEANVHTYGAIIDGCARAGETAKAFGVYKSMISKDIKPDRVIFNSLINACGRSGAVNRAFEVFSELKSEEVPLDPNHVTMCSLIDACARAGDAESAYEVYKMMRERKIQGTPEPYTAAVHACSRSGDLSRAVSIYEDMKRDRIQPDEVFFSALMDVAGHAGRIDSAFELLHEVEKYSVAPGPIIFSSLMGVCSNTGNWEKAVELYTTIQALGLRPTVSTLNALVTALCRGKQFETAIQSLTELKESGVSPNQVTYTILLEACEKENEAEVGLNLYFTAVTEGIRPSLAICESMLGICLEGIQSFKYPPKLTTSSTNPSHLVGDTEKLYHQWMSWALTIYRQTVLTGVTPSISLLSQILACLRIPDQDDRNELGLTFQTESTTWNRHLLEGFGVYDPRASALYGEAAALGIVPSFQCDAEPILFDVDSVPVYVAEVCVITILKALRHRSAVDAELPIVTFTFESNKKTVLLADRRIKDITVTSRNGQAIAALLRRLRLRFNGKEYLGRIRLIPPTLSRWFRPSGGATRRIEQNVSSSNVLGKSIAEQQRAIRMGTPLPSSERRGGGSNVNHRYRNFPRN